MQFYGIFCFIHLYGNYAKNTTKMSGSCYYLNIWYGCILHFWWFNMIWNHLKKFHRNYHYKIDFCTTGIALQFQKHMKLRKPDRLIIHYTITRDCTHGSNLSLHRQFVFSFNKPRQSYYTNPILWSILMANVLFLASR